jgi:hypothetical protein
VLSAADQNIFVLSGEVFLNSSTLIQTCNDDGEIVFELRSASWD